MAGKIITKILYVLTAVITIFNLIAGVKESLFFDIDRLPEGKLVSSSVSPDEKRILNIYSVSNSVGSAVRGEIVYKNEKKNIFWQTGITTADSYWINDKGVSINGVGLNVVNEDTYDSRRGTSLFQKGNLGGEAAPENIAGLNKQNG